MYIRQLKQYLRAVDATFDERKYGFETLGDLMRACQRDGVLRIERDRQGGMRIFPGTLTPVAGDAAPMQDDPESQDNEAQDNIGNVAEPSESFDRGWTPPAEIASEQDVVEGAVLQEREVTQVVDAEEAPAPAERPSRRRPRAAKSARPAGEARSTRKAADSAGLRWSRRIEGAQAGRQATLDPQPRAHRRFDTSRT